MTNSNLTENQQADADNDGGRLQSLRAGIQEVRDILFGPNSHASWPDVKAELQKLKANDAAPSGAAEATSMSRTWNIEVRLQ